MSNETKDQSLNQNTPGNKTSNHDAQTKPKPTVDSSQVVNPSEDLVYKGGYTNDPEEILSNPAVAPQMLDDRRDLRADLSRDSEDV